MTEKPSYADLEKEVAALRAENERNSRFAKINRALFEIANSVSTTASLSELFPAIHRSLAAIIDTTNFYIALYDEERDTVSFPYHIDIIDEECSDLVGVTGMDSLTAKVLEIKRPLLITRSEIVRQKEASGFQIIVGDIPEIWLGVPLLAQDTSIGVMAVQSYEGPTFYDATDVETMYTVAAQVAIAIERKKIELRLQDSLHRFRMIIEDVSGIAIQGYDEKRRVTFWNTASEKLYGYTEREVLGQKLEDLIIPAAMQDEVIRQIDKWLNGGEAIPAGELVLADKHGHDVPVFSSHVLYEGRGGKEMFCIDMDLQPVKKAEASLRAANANFLAAMDSLDAAVYVADMKSHELLFMNTKVSEFCGAKVGDICWTALQSGQTQPCTFCTNDRLLDKDGSPRPPYIWEFLNTRTGRWYQCRDQAIHWPDGRLVRLEIAVDITDRKEMEARLRDSEERFRTLHDASFTGICIHDNGVILECNNALAEMSGFSRDELIGTNGFQLITPECRQEVFTKLRDKYPHPYAAQGQRKDGTIIDIRIQGKEIPYKGKIVRVAEFSDITIHRQAEKALEESAGKHRIIFENSPLGMIYFEADGTILDCNAKFLELMGADRDRLIGFNTARQSSQPMQAAIKKALAGEQSFFEDYYTSITGGKTTCLRVMFNPVNPGQNPTKVIATLEDISERKMAEQALRESAERFQTFFSAINDAVLVHPFQEVGFAPFIEVNDIACERYGYTREEFKKLSISDISKEEFSVKHGNVKYRRNLYEDGHLFVESVHLKKSGAEFFVEINANIIEQAGRPVIMAVVRDITERKSAELERAKLEDQLQQAQKLDSIGRLAGGIAHDFNNMLGVILGRAEMIMEDADASLPWHEDLLEIHRAADRSANLTRQLLAFARKQTMLPQYVDLSNKISETLGILRRLIGENIELAWRPVIDIWTVRIDPGQVDQILTNLCVNARDAITGNGRICIDLHNAFLSENLHSDTQEEQAGDYVVLSVTDNGCGMNEEVLGNLFEPFFTTKAVGKGTGLGLATVYGIVKQNKGFVRVKSTPGEGSTFTIYLPRCISPSENLSESPSASSLSGRDSQTVLLVEDEPAILTLIHTMLLRLGYKVIAASTPGMALRLAADHQGPIDILLTDIIMPEMDGLRLSEKILALQPTILKIFMSGYTDDVIADSGVLGEALNFIQKPFTRKELANILAEFSPPLKKLD